jgi:DNA-directed RNA polymerase specialized sigma24 family protein
MAQALRSDQFEELLRRLAPDRDLAGERYEQLRRRLITVFTYRRCAHPEELVDETMDRVARKLAEMGTDFEGSDPAPFVFGVAWNVARESFKRHATVPLPDHWDVPDPSPPLREEGPPLEDSCLERCLQRLAEEERTLVLKYFQGEKRAKIRHRWALAAELRLTPNALRLKIHRLTRQLRTCVFHCVDLRGRLGLVTPRLVPASPKG